jgi:aryl-phospho-beta-D-glucosidase BglC (GH1 family)
VSFVGRPFPLEADEHFARLRAWGFNFLRLLVTWEAIEHAGPSLYDETYLDYLRAVAARAGDFGFQLYIDPHQDMWSRFSGGDGAPAGR